MKNIHEKIQFNKGILKGLIYFVFFLSIIIAGIIIFTDGNQFSELILNKFNHALNIIQDNVSQNMIIFDKETAGGAGMP